MKLNRILFYKILFYKKKMKFFIFFWLYKLIIKFFIYLFNSLFFFFVYIKKVINFRRNNSVNEK
jgi:hypothetical protein